MALRQSYRARKRIFLWDRSRNVEKLVLSEFLGQRFSCCLIFFLQEGGESKGLEKITLLLLLHGLLHFIKSSAIKLIVYLLRAHSALVC